MATSPRLKFRASDAHRWTSCMASVREEAQRPKEESTYATDGIVFHEVIEPYIKAMNPERPDPFPVLPCPGNKVTVDGVEHDVTDEHLQHVETCTNYISMILEQMEPLPNSYEIFVELKVDYGTWTVEGQIGYIDILIIDRVNHVLHVIDTKYGKGIEVYAVKNAQESLYALGAIQQLGIFEEAFESVELHIMQPRRDHFDKWVTTPAELAAWGSETKAIADRIIASDDLPFNPAGKTCRFCKAKSDCRALAEGALSTVSEGFENIVESFDAIDRRTDIKLTDIPPLTPTEIFNVYHNIDMVRVFLKAIESRAYALYMGGDAPENNGCKLVAGKTNRVWKDKKKADAALGRAKLDSKTRREEWKLKSPAQVEKIIGKEHKIMKTYVDKPPGAPTLVPLSDKRPAINTDEDAAEGFEGAEEGDMLIESTTGETKTVTFDEPVATDMVVTEGNARLGLIDKAKEIVDGVGIDKETGEIIRRPADKAISWESPGDSIEVSPGVNNRLASMADVMTVTEERGPDIIESHFLDEAFDDSDYQKIKPVSLFDEADNEN